MRVSGVCGKGTVFSVDSHTHTHTHSHTHTHTHTHTHECFIQGDADGGFGAPPGHTGLSRGPPWHGKYNLPTSGESELAANAIANFELHPKGLRLTLLAQDASRCTTDQVYMWVIRVALACGVGMEGSLLLF